MRFFKIGFISVTALLGIVAVFLFLFLRQGTSSISGQIFDAGNGMPVYGAKVKFDNKSTTLYLSKEFRLTSLPRGNGILTVTAPGFYEEVRKLTLKGRKMEISIPLRGKEVPGLGGILVWGEWEGDDLRLDLRLTTIEGKGIEYFPALAFGAEVRISENLGTPQAPVRGQLLFDGRPRLYLDLSSKLEKLKCKIRSSEIKAPRPGVVLGVLDFVLHTNQRTFTWVRGDINLEKEKA
jgi:hypothetical protein